MKPNTCDIIHVDTGWLAGPAHRAAGCSLLFSLSRDQQLWPALPATRSWSAFRSVTLLQSFEASACGCKPLPGSLLHWLEGKLFYGLCRGIVHLWGTTLKAASSKSPHDTLVFSMELDAGKHSLFSSSCWMWPPAHMPFETFSFSF